MSFAAVSWTRVQLMAVLLAFAVCVLPSVSRAQRLPGAKVQLSQEGLDYAARIGVEVMSRRLSDQTLPDKRGNSRVEVGNVEWEVNEARIVSFTAPSSHVAVSPHSAMTWTTTNAGIQVHGNWRYQYKVWRFRVSDSGSFELSVHGATTSLRLAMGVGPEGRPSVTVLACTSDIERVGVRLHGGASWFYNLFSSVIENALKGELRQAVCAEATRAIQVNANEQMATLDVTVPLDSGYRVDCRLLGTPSMQTGYIEMSNMCEAFAAGDSSSAPINAQPITTSAPSRMITAYLSEYTANTIGHVLHQHNVLAYNLTRSDLPAAIRSQLSTSCATGELESCFGTWFPRAHDLFPGREVVLYLRTTQRPTLEITAAVARANFTGRVEAVVREATGGGGVTPVLSLAVAISVDLRAEISDNHIRAEVAAVRPVIEVLSSGLGDVPSDQLSFLVQFVLDVLVVPELNRKGSEGFLIPNMAGVQFDNPTLSLMEGALVVATDVRYSP